MPLTDEEMIAYLREEYEMCKIRQNELSTKIKQMEKFLEFRDALNDEAIAEQVTKINRNLNLDWRA